MPNGCAHIRTWPCWNECSSSTELVWFVNDSVRCRLPVRVDTLHKAWLLTPTPRLRAGPGGRTAWRIGLRLRKTKGLCSAGGYLPNPGSVWPGRDCDSRSVRGWLHTSKPIEEQDRGQTVRERDRDRWEERWDTNTQIQRGRERQDREIISHCISCWKMPTSILTKQQRLHTIAQKTGT